MRFQFTILFCAAAAGFLLLTMFFAGAALATGFFSAGAFLTWAGLTLPLGTLISSSDSDDESSSLSATAAGYGIYFEEAAG